MNRLAAVLVIDIVDSTDLLEEHGTSTPILARGAVDEALLRACTGISGQATRLLAEMKQGAR